MIYLLYSNNGQILCTGETQVSEEEFFSLNPLSLFVEADQKSQYINIETKSIVNMPPAPNEYCVFNYDTKQWVDPRTNETQWLIVKSQRDTLLVASDWTQLSDVVLSNKDQWKVYRQELRDITTQSDPFNIIWPTPPQG